MQGSPKVVEFLNDALSAELTAINQYFVAAKLAANWGYEKLAKYQYEESLDEMRHAEALIERIVMLEGVPNMQRLYTVRVGESPVEQFELDLEMEREAVQRYRRGVGICVDEDDPTTRAFLERKLADEEEHVDWLETQFQVLDQLGFANYMLKWV